MKQLRRKMPTQKGFFLEEDVHAGDGEGSDEEEEEMEGGEGSGDDDDDEEEEVRCTGALRGVAGPAA